MQQAKTPVFTGRRDIKKNHPTFLILANKLHNSNSSGALRSAGQSTAAHGSINARSIEAQRTRIKEVAGSKKVI